MRCRIPMFTMHTDQVSYISAFIKTSIPHDLTHDVKMIDRVKHEAKIKYPTSLSLSHTQRLGVGGVTSFGKYPVRH